MQIVTDSGTDLMMTKDEQARLHIHILPLSVTLDGVTYREAVDINAEEFYPRLAESKELPTTSQPAVGEVAALYRKLAEEDKEILSIHMSSGLSGTYQSALGAAAMVPEAHITVLDTRTLSSPAGWQVEAAARCALAGWPLDKITALMQRINEATDVVFTLKELRYLIHGGRISHMKGLIASLLNIKPIIGVEKERGTYVQRGQTRSFGGAIKSVADLIAHRFGEGGTIRAQVVHAQNLEGAQQLIDEVSRRFKVNWLPMGQLSLVLGAHTGPSMIGIAFAPEDVFSAVP